MFDQLSEQLATVIKTNPWMAPLAALLGGLLTAANPCVIAMVPLMMGYVAGQENRGTLRSLALSATFCVGLTIMFGVLYFAVVLLSATAQEALNAKGLWPYIAGAVCLLMGLHLFGVLKFDIPAPRGMQPKQRGYVGALLLGLLFGLVSLPCAGPVLAALYALVTIEGAVTLNAIVILLAYSLGHCALILVGGTSMGLVQRMADSKGWTSGVAYLRNFAGVVIIAVGLWVLYTAPPVGF